MRRLLLIRHAKSSWEHYPRVDDFERALAPRGRQAAPSMGRYLLEHGLVPDQVLCSPARRAAETWEHIAPELGGVVPVEFEPDLYGASPTAILRLVQSQPVEHGTVLVVGHNPGLEETALALSGSGPRELIRQMELKYPTGALAEIEFEGDVWGEIDWGLGRLERFIRPKDL